MTTTRRDFLLAASSLAASLGLPARWLGAQGPGIAPVCPDEIQPVIWLVGQACSGCSVSLLNSIQQMDVAELLTAKITLDYHPTLMAGAGAVAQAAAEASRSRKGYILVVEGAIPTAANGAHCLVWDGLTMLDAVKRYSQDALFTLAVGTCAAYGGIPGASPDATGARGAAAVLGSSARVVNLPGCPVHPDWVVGTVAAFLATGAVPALDGSGRPLTCFATRVHQRCPQRNLAQAASLGQAGCLENLGCRGKQTYADCPDRRWNGPGPGQPGVSWCVGARNPCLGCTEPDFPDGKSPFYR